MNIRVEPDTGVDDSALAPGHYVSLGTWVAGPAATRDAAENALVRFMVDEQGEVEPIRSEHAWTVETLEQAAALARVLRVPIPARS